jgi:hypothetical protein
MMLTGVWGAFVFGAVVAVSPSRWNMFSLRGMFLHCPSNADYLYASPNESLAENAASPLAVGEVPLVSGNSGGRLVQGNGHGSRTATQFWFGIAVAPLLTDGPFGTTREFFPQIPASPKVGNVPYLGIRSISGIIHMTVRLPHAARTGRGRCGVDRHLAVNKGERGMTLEPLNCRQPHTWSLVFQMQIPRFGRACARRLRR